MSQALDADEDRYAHLVDEKYRRGLTLAEQEEMKSLLTTIDSKFDDFYDPILRALRQMPARSASSGPRSVARPATKEKYKDAG